MAAVIVAATLAVIPQTAAADADAASAESAAVVLPPPRYTASECAGQTPIVVGSDAKAQSDIYSAVTLAGAIGTGCVILAGPRDGAMPAAQRARLDAAADSGYAVGGTAAVPDAKIAGRSLSRVSGGDRWTTAQRVGAVARSLAGDDAPDAPSLNASLGAPADTAQPGVHLHGAGPWIASDCSGDTPVVVGSDAEAQSDIYSAFTLAGVIGTDCVILAGPRTGEMPPSQSKRFAAAAADGGFVVGGTAVVRASKTPGREMTRLAGTDRWETAHLVGRRARGDTTAGTPIRDLTDLALAVAVDVDEREPAVGEAVRIVATVTDEDGNALVGAELELIVEGKRRGTAHTDSGGRAAFAYRAPRGPANEGGYDSIQVHILSTSVASRPTGVFWQQPESRRITVSVSPDRAHSNAVRTITAQAFDGTTPMAGQAVELHIDGRMLGRATTGPSGTAVFTRRAPFQGPFDLAKVVLAGDHGVASEEKLFSWPLYSRGDHSSNDWQLVWGDEFSGDALDAAKWESTNNCPPVYLSCETDRPENVYVEDGMLHLQSLREQYVGTNDWTGTGEQFGPLTTYTPGTFQRKDFTAGRVTTGTSFTYGRFEMLGKLPQGHGTFFAYWMIPAKGSPYGRGTAAGEIDIAEGANIGVPNDGRTAIDAQLPGPGWGVHHVVHMGYPFTNPFTLTNLAVNPAESFHLYALEWDTASLRFYVDGKRVHTVARSDWFSHPRGAAAPLDNPYAPFDVPFVVTISNVVGGWATQTLPDHKVPDSTVFPADFVVDYVRIYECRPPEGTKVAGPGQGCETP